MVVIKRRLGRNLVLDQYLLKVVCHLVGKVEGLLGKYHHLELVYVKIWIVFSEWELMDGRFIKMLIASNLIHAE